MRRSLPALSSSALMLSLLPSRMMLPWPLSGCFCQRPLRLAMSALSWTLPFLTLPALASWALSSASSAFSSSHWLGWRFLASILAFQVTCGSQPLSPVRCRLPCRLWMSRLMSRMLCSGSRVPPPLRVSAGKCLPRASPSMVTARRSGLPLPLALPCLEATMGFFGSPTRRFFQRRVPSSCGWSRLPLMWMSLLMSPPMMGSRRSSAGAAMRRSSAALAASALPLARTLLPASCSCRSWRFSLPAP